MTVPTCFRQIWALDTEFHHPVGERPSPICLVAKELFTGAVRRRWLWGQPSPEPPLPGGPDVLVVAYSATAEWSVYLALGWPLPARILDLYAEYRWLLSGRKVPGYGQLDAMATFNLPGMDDFFKQDMRSVCIRGGPFSAAEEAEILTYCEEDLNGLAALFDAMEERLEWPQALARGRYTAALARVEAAGVPLDRATHSGLRQHRESICRELIEETASQFGVYDDTHFDTDGFEAYLASQGIAWPRTPTGRLSTAEDTFEDMVDVYPQLRPLYELRSALNQLKDDGGLSVGKDGRNRTSLRPFATSSGRNSPSTTRFVFGKSTAFRSLIRPDPGWALAYVDWSQQEFGIAAVLSDDHNMRQAYLSGDPYLEFAKQAGAVPSSATKKTHGDVRDLFKTCMLGVNYSMGSTSLARRIKRPLAYARELLQLHHQVYRGYWRWVEMVQDQAMLTGRLQAVFGWQVNVGPQANWRSLRNFPCQANGAEMLRLGLSLAVERGVRVVAPVHDAMMVEAPLDDIDLAVRQTRQAMAEASKTVLDGFELRTDAAVVRHPDRYRDKRGVEFWALLMGILGKVQAQVSPPQFVCVFLLCISLSLCICIKDPVPFVPLPPTPPWGVRGGVRGTPPCPPFRKSWLSTGLRIDKYSNCRSNNSPGHASPNLRL
jgi:DNA polymerase I-like protein with 3'-5' exonuclease and polymerase domains